MKYLDQESVSYCPIHGYIPFVGRADGEGEDTVERDLIDHAWVQRLRQIHQLQSAWWVYPTAEHTRFQHVLGSMHLASRAVSALYDSLKEVCPETPSRGYVECLARMAALLHDVGHGPFGHFFDDHYLRHYGLTHETLGARIIVRELGELLGGIRRCPNSQLEPGERLDPEQVARLITRPRDGQADESPRWLILLRSLFCGMYTVDNMDFVLRDAFMSGYSTQAFDLDRLLRYSFFSPSGLTIHRRGVDALVRFLSVRSELFRAVYFHRTVRAFDLALSDLFAESRQFLFSGNPLDHLEEYRHFTEWSLFVDVARWPTSDDPKRRALGQRWERLLNREIPWSTICERNLVFAEDDRERGSIFSDPELVEMRLRKNLPEALRELPLRIDLPRHIHRPSSHGLIADQNFLYSSDRDEVLPLADDQLFRHLPLVGRICRVYADKKLDRETCTAVAAALDDLLGSRPGDDLTNM